MVIFVFLLSPLVVLGLALVLERVETWVEADEAVPAPATTPLASGPVVWRQTEIVVPLPRTETAFEQVVMDRRVGQP